MAKTNKIVYVTQAQYDSLITDGYVTVSGVTYTYDANNTYMVREDGLEGVDVQSTGATSGKVLTADGSGGASWQTAGGGAPEGTAVLSTGVTSGKVLTANGSGGATWETAGGGGSGDVTASGTLSVGSVILGLGSKTVTASSGTNGKFLAWSGGSTWKGLYMHTVNFYNTDSIDYGPVNLYFMFISTSSTPLTTMGGVPAGKYPASGVYQDSNSGSNFWVAYIDTNSEEVGYVNSSSGYIETMIPFDMAYTSVTDTVIQIA